MWVIEAVRAAIVGKFLGRGFVLRKGGNGEQGE
jgi:hypothetical protein